MTTNRCLTTILFALFIATMNILPADAESPTRIDTRQLTLSQDELVKAVAGRPSQRAYANYGGNFGRYWQAAESGYTGKTFEAMIMESDNARYARTGQPTRLFSTAVAGQPWHGADLVARTKGNSKEVLYQCKLGWREACTALSDPKYAGMHILTTSDALATIRKELSFAETQAARRGIPLSDFWEQTRRALASGRLMQTTPAGMALPGRQAVSDRARAVVARSWSQTASHARFKSTADLTGRALILKTPSDAARVTRLLRNPATGSGTAAAGIDGVLAYTDYQAGNINKTELADRLQDAAVKGAAVGAGIHLLYLFTTTPHGLVVVGVAIITYEASNRVLAYLRAEQDREFVTLDDLRGRVSDSFLDSLPRSLADAHADAEKVATRRLEMLR